MTGTGRNYRKKPRWQVLRRKASDSRAPSVIIASHYDQGDLVKAVDVREIERKISSRSADLRDHKAFRQGDAVMLENEHARTADAECYMLTSFGWSRVRYHDDSTAQRFQERDEYDDEYEETQAYRR